MRKRSGALPLGASPRIDVGEVFRDGTLIDRALVASFAETVLRHRRTSTPPVIWRDGRVVEVPPDEVPVPNADEVPLRTARSR